jgi:probable F420-dependent oxidoreductase
VNIGLFAIGIGPGAGPAAIGEFARNGERLGFSTLWAAEHVVLFDRLESKYPYSPEGRWPLPGETDWYDPFLTLSYAAAMTSRIRLATGICLVPEHNPLILAKQAATLDRLSNGRFAFGVGIGWSAEEFAALGIPFERRAQRTREYIDAMRRLWGEKVTSYRGEFLRFENVRSYPKPASGAKLPVIFGGESLPALRRAAEYGDGWYGFNLGPGEAAKKIQRLRSLAGEKRRDVREIEIIVSPYFQQISTDDLSKYRDAGVDELVMVPPIPEDESQIAAVLEQAARKWLEPARRLK